MSPVVVSTWVVWGTLSDVVAFESVTVLVEYSGRSVVVFMFVAVVVYCMSPVVVSV